MRVRDIEGDRKLLWESFHCETEVLAEAEVTVAANSSEQMEMLKLSMIMSICWEDLKNLKRPDSSICMLELADLKHEVHLSMVF